VGIEKDPDNGNGNVDDYPVELETYAHLPSCFFTVRLWSEVLGDGRAEWRGQVQHVITQERCYFRNWSTLESFLERKLSESLV
jgi:hypothetical protein